jgi:Spy/CpxP family protein refolding chaperone
MKNLNLKTITVAMIMILISGVTLQAQEAREDHVKRGRGEVQDHQRNRQHRGLNIPDLTEEQTSQIEAFKVDHQKEALGIENELNELEAKLQSLTTSEAFNKNEVDGVINEISSLKSQHMKLKIYHMEDIKSVLNDEQIVFLNAQLSKVKKRRSRRRR